MPRAAASGPNRGRGPTAHTLSEEFPAGTIVRDAFKRQWKLGQTLGKGGFGRIYCATPHPPHPVSNKFADYAIKIEPSTNGPLFCEINFFNRVAQQEEMDKFISSHKLKYLGVPPFVGFGMHSYNAQDYRFLLMRRFGRDLQKVITGCCGTLPEQTVFTIGLRMIDALQFIHEREFVHADIKSSNIMLGFNEGKEVSNEVYLCDYGLTYRYLCDGKHKDYKEDPKKAHEGTIEFTSRDAHKGVFPARRGDLEILGYCLLHMLCGKLPWEDKLGDPKYVAARKIHYMRNVSSFIKDCFPVGKSNASDTMLKYVQAVSQLSYEEKPNYNALKAHLKSGLKKSGQINEWEIDFPTQPKGQKRKSNDTPELLSPKRSRSASPKKKAAPAKSSQKKKAAPAKSSPKKKAAPAKASPKKKATPTKASPKKKPVSSEMSPMAMSVSPKKTSEANSPGITGSRGRKAPSSSERKNSRISVKKVVNGIHSIAPPKSKSKVLQMPPPTKTTPKSKTPKSKAQKPQRSSPRQMPPKSKVFQMPPPSKRS